MTKKNQRYKSRGGGGETAKGKDDEYGVGLKKKNDQRQTNVNKSFQPFQKHLSNLLKHFFQIL